MPPIILLLKMETFILFLVFSYIFYDKKIRRFTYG